VNKQITIRNRVLLLILDGFGTNPSKANNAVLQAKTPKLDEYFSEYSHTLLEASGEAVGLPPGQMGNSEVGHMTIGCGSIIRQDLIRINDAIADGSFFEMSPLLRSIDKAKKKEGYIHIIGLVSDGGVHSHIDHVIALMKLCRDNQVRPVLHIITDGRDTPPKSALKFVAKLEKAAKQSNAIIATLMGRYYAMDRDRRWERTIKAFEALVQLKGEKCTNAKDAVEKAYARGESDEFILPSVLGNALPMTGESEVVFCNFRNDRPRQLSKALAKEGFHSFDRGPSYEVVKLTMMTKYSKEYLGPVVFPPRKPETNLAEVVSNYGLYQFHCAETEKYPHVTYFLNGGQEEAYEKEDRKMVASPKVATYDLQPEMSAPLVTQKIIQAMENIQPNFICLNYANTDMVGHTGDMKAAIQAAEAVDEQLQNLIQNALNHNYQAIIIADHGNSDVMINPDGSPNTAHTTNPVPCIYVSKRADKYSLSDGKLADIAPTILGILDIEVPEIMTGDNLLKSNDG